MDAARFQGYEVICREDGIIALAADTSADRSRAAYESDEAFSDAVACGLADRYTFETLAEAADFADRKLKEWAKAGQKIEDRLRSQNATAIAHSSSGRNSSSGRRGRV